MTKLTRKLRTTWGMILFIFVWLSIASISIALAVLAGMGINNLIPILINLEWYWWVIGIETAYILITGFGFVFGWIWAIFKEWFTETNLFTRYKRKTRDKSAVIMADNIVVAHGWECNDCNCIRPYTQEQCGCKIDQELCTCGKVTRCGDRSMYCEKNNVHYNL